MTIICIILQSLVNDYSLNRSPKTTRSFYGFIATVIYVYTNKKYNITLPVLYKKVVYTPTLQDIKLIIEKSENTRYEIPLLLASYGMRIGEIQALTINDIEDGKININKTLVIDEKYDKIIKKPKTFESSRILAVPLFITDKIKHKKVIYNGSNTAINRWLYKIQKELGIPLFSIHKFRHFFATELHNRNIPNKYIQALGGWATDNIMKSVYQHTNKEISAINFFT